MEKRIIAITGPSGVGKSTLSSSLTKEYNIAVPMHCTTRTRRNDDIEGFYRFLSHDEFRNHVIDDDFFLWSGDGETVDKSFGNFYGILKSDCDYSFNISENIIIFISYKDVKNIETLKSQGLNIFLINLKYDNIVNEMDKRLRSSLLRNHTERDIQARINCAIEYEKKFGAYIDSVSDLIVYTDQNTPEQTLDIVTRSLSGYVRKRYF